MPSGERWVYWQGASVFSVTLEGGFQFRGMITHQDDGSTNGDASVRRALYVGVL